MNGRPWETELEQFLQSKLDALSVTPNQGIGRRTVRIFPPPAEDEAKYFMLGMEAGLFEVGQDGRIQSRLLALPAEHSETGEIFGLFTSEPGTPRLVRERVVQLAAAAALIFDRGWLERQVQLLPSGAGDPVDILLRSLSGKLLTAVAIKRTAPELTKLDLDLSQCCRRGEHPIDNCGFPQNHRYFEYCVSHRPPYFWAVAPGADVCFQLAYPLDGIIQIQTLSTLPRRSRIELEHESYWRETES